MFQPFPASHGGSRRGQRDATGWPYRPIGGCLALAASRARAGGGTRTRNAPPPLLLKEVRVLSDPRSDASAIGPHLHTRTPAPRWRPLFNFAAAQSSRQATLPKHRPGAEGRNRTCAGGRARLSKRPSAADWKSADMPAAIPRMRPPKGQLI